MKKLIQKPSNWQDFESLCKMLWGEIWGIPDKIKQNGRLGQEQCGVDVYGRLKDSDKYSGIQCKGKNDNLKSVLTKKEIDTEIENAKSFVPELETFIFATTANKDVKIEQYVREKDIESRKNGGFEILLYCWEDISDLIETNRNTFNYYVSKNQFKTNFEFELTFADGEKTNVITPKFRKTTTKYKLKTDSEIKHEKAMLASMGIYQGTFANLPKPFPKTGTNASWAKVSLQFKNIGSVVIEDFKIYVTPDATKIREMKKELSKSGLPILQMPSDPFWVFDDENYGIYKRKDNAPLIQKDPKNITFYLLVNRDASEIKIKYELLARDFNMEDELTLKVEPTYDLVEKIIQVDTEQELKPDSVEIGDYIK